ncbi:MAG: hypothetical protein HUJ53_02765 [Holdemanella sp.]|nr:hypothetical protein [Holdemanella sp.]
MKKLLQVFVSLSMVFQIGLFPTLANEEETIMNDVDEVVYEEVEDTIDLDKDESWVNVEGFYYYYENGVKVTGWTYQNGKWYYLLPDEDGKMATGRHKIDDDYYCFSINGDMYANKYVQYTGTIPGTRYYQANGKEVHGWHYNNSVNKWQYFWTSLNEAMNGKMIVNQFLEIDGKYYFFDASGYMFENGWLQRNNEWYYFINGSPLTGIQTINGKIYYFREDYTMRSNAVVRTGNGIYHFGNDGAAYMNAWVFYNAIWYYYDANGFRYTGWVKSGNSWYYTTQEGMLVNTEFLDTDGSYYYLNDSGVMISNCWFLYNTHWKYYTGSGRAQAGWLLNNNKWYYLDPNNECIMLSDEARTINGHRYYFDGSGKMVTNTFVNKDGQSYYYDGEGHEMSGWYKLNGKWFYFVPEYNNAMAKDGYQLIENGYVYTFDSNGGYVRTDCVG